MSYCIYSILVAAIKAIALGGGGIILFSYGVRHAMGIKAPRKDRGKIVL